MAQRVLVAMALINDPSLIIADEPTTGLDVTVQATVLDLLQGLVSERGTAIWIITHDLGVIANLHLADSSDVRWADRGDGRNRRAVSLTAAPLHSRVDRRNGNRSAEETSAHAPGSSWSTTGSHETTEGMPIRLPLSLGRACLQRSYA